MRVAMILLGLSAAAAAVPAEATIVSFVASGTLSSVEYDFGGPASAAFLSGTPLGSPYQLKFSYDSESQRAYGGPAGGTYLGIATTSFSLDGQTFELPPVDVSVSGGFAANSSRFSMFGNFGFGQPTLNGFRPIDLSFDLIDATNRALGPTLPASLNLADFSSKRLRIRFAGNQGETGLLFSVTNLTTAAVPEPYIWALMISGFGLAGATVRRRKIIPTYV